MSGFGTYNLSGGSITGSSIDIRNGINNQSDSASASINYLYLTGSTSAYYLAGGTLTTSTTSCSSRFEQSGGTHTTTYQYKSGNKPYVFSGGRLNVSTLSNSGTFDFAAPGSYLSVSKSLDMSTGTWKHLENATISGSLPPPTSI